MKFFSKLFPWWSNQEVSTVSPTPLHVHSFELIAKTVAEPRGIVTDPEKYISARIALGTTTYLWECVECGTLRREELLGSEESTLSNVLSKVDEQGLVKINRDGKTYLVGPVEEQKTGLPIR